MVLLAMNHLLCLKGTYQPTTRDHHPNVSPFSKNKMFKTELITSFTSTICLEIQDQNHSPTPTIPHSAFKSSWFHLCCISLMSSLSISSATMTWIKGSWQNFLPSILSSSSNYLLRTGESSQSRFWATLFIVIGSHHSLKHSNNA